jgi:myo-inositol-1-phosphate synthase
MQLKLNFLCRDSILAAPVALDLALLMDLCARAGMEGIQEWLSFFFKRPMTHGADEIPEHDLFRQLTVLEERLRGLGAPIPAGAGAPGADPRG